MAPLNGDTKLILDRLMAIEVKQKERHRENKEDIGVLFKKVGRVDNLDCNVHAERMKGLGIGLKILYGIIVAVLLIWVKQALAL